MIRYVVWNPGNRKGEFNFLTSTQQNWTQSENGAINEARDEVEDTRLSCDPQMTQAEALEELGGKPVVYKLTIEKIPYQLKKG